MSEPSQQEQTITIKKQRPSELYGHTRLLKRRIDQLSVFLLHFDAWQVMQTVFVLEELNRRRSRDAGSFGNFLIRFNINLYQMHLDAKVDSALKLSFAFSLYSSTTALKIGFSVRHGPH